MSQPPSDRPEGGPPPAPTPNRLFPRCRLVLHPSPAADMMFVIRTIMDLTHFCRAEATHRMWEAHHFGRSQLLIAHRERAELYAEQFAAKGLAVTLEVV